MSPGVGLWRSLGARFHGMEEVVGSIPTRSTKSIQQFSVPSQSSYFRFNPSSNAESWTRIQPSSSGRSSPKNWRNADIT